MVDFEVESIFASVCSRLILAEGDELETILRGVADAGNNISFMNRRVELDEDDVQDSEIEFSSGELDTPRANERNYVIVDFHDELEPNQIHLHSYFDIGNIDEISDFYRGFNNLVENIRISSVEADLFVDTDASEMGFKHDNRELSLQGVKFSYDSMEFSLYSVEHGSIIRVLREDPEIIDGAEYETFVSEKLDQMKSDITSIPL